MNNQPFFTVFESLNMTSETGHEMVVRAMGRTWDEAMDNADIVYIDEDGKILERYTADLAVYSDRIKLLAGARINAALMAEYEKYWDAKEGETA